MKPYPINSLVKYKHPKDVDPACSGWAADCLRLCRVFKVTKQDPGTNFDIIETVKLYMSDNKVDFQHYTPTLRLIRENLILVKEVEREKKSITVGELV